MPKTTCYTSQPLSQETTFYNEAGQVFRPDVCPPCYDKLQQLTTDRIQEVVATRWFQDTFGKHLFRSGETHTQVYVVLESDRVTVRQGEQIFVFAAGERQPNADPQMHHLLNDTIKTVNEIYSDCLRNHKTPARRASRERDIHYHNASSVSHFNNTNNQGLHSQSRRIAATPFRIGSESSHESDEGEVSDTDSCVTCSTHIGSESSHESDEGEVSDADSCVTCTSQDSDKRTSAASAAARRPLAVLATSSSDRKTGGDGRPQRLADNNMWTPCTQDTTRPVVAVGGRVVLSFSSSQSDSNPPQSPMVRRNDRSGSPTQPQTIARIRLPHHCESEHPLTSLRSQQNLRQGFFPDNIHLKLQGPNGSATTLSATRRPLAILARHSNDETDDDADDEILTIQTRDTPLQILSRGHSTSLQSQQDLQQRSSPNDLSARFHWIVAQLHKQDKLQEEEQLERLATEAAEMEELCQEAMVPLISCQHSLEEIRQQLSEQNKSYTQILARQHQNYDAHIQRMQLQHSELMARGISDHLYDMDCTAIEWTLFSDLRVIGCTAVQNNRVQELENQVDNRKDQVQGLNQSTKTSTASQTLDRQPPLDPWLPSQTASLPARLPAAPGQTLATTLDLLNSSS